MKQHLMAALKNIRVYVRYLCIQHSHFRKVEKRILFLTITPLFIFFATQAQTSNSRWKENFDIHKFRTSVIDITATTGILQLKNIKGITIVDARADTANVGFMQKKIVDPITGAFGSAVMNQSEQKINTRPTFIVLGAGLQKEALKYANQSINFSNNDSLPGILMVIKKLWLSDELNISNRPSGARLTGDYIRDVWTSGADVSIEFYLQNKLDYYPLYRYDSIITEVMTISEYGHQFIELSLQLSLEKMKKMDQRISSIMSKRKFSIEEINNHNEKEFDVPALIDTVFKPGVYMTFDEFKNNSPSQTDYEIKKDKLTDIIYIKQPGGAEFTTREIWGYSDGKNAYVKSANNYFLLQRYVNAFYIFGAKTINQTIYGNTGRAGYLSNNTGIPAPIYYTGSKTAIQLEPFQLDWSTGKLY